MNKKTICKIPSCSKNVLARELCNSHYRKLKKYGSPLVSKQSSTEDIRSFIKRALATETDDCIPWPYGKNGAGYGVFQLDSVKWLVHRYILFEKKGPPPSENFDAAHLPVICHNRACINHRHLDWATRSENQNHKILDKTLVFGDFHPSTKISEADLPEIINSSESQSTLGRRFGVCQPQISKIKNRKRRTANGL